MKLSTKILLIWFALGALSAAAYAFLPHMEEKPVALALFALMTLGGIVTTASAIYEPNKKNKAIFANIAVFFFAGAAQFVHLFIGKHGVLLVASPYANFYTYQFGTLSLLPFLQAFALVYVLIDSFFRDIPMVRKYAITLLIAGGFFGYYYYPVIENPKYLYKTPDIQDWKVIDRAVSGLTTEGVENPSIHQIADRINLSAWKDGEEVGTLYHDAKIRRIREILPYVQGENNFIPLLYKPLYLNAVFLNVLCIFFVLLFFGYQYRKDPPQGAYIEKIVFLFLPYASFEALHNFAFAKSVEFDALQHLVGAGHYLTLINLLLLVIFFSLRLSFITSVKGEFYERELVFDAEHISRWRDGIDNLVIRHFLNPETLHGRLFAPREAKSRS